MFFNFSNVQEKKKQKMASETALIVLGAGSAVAFVVYLHYKRKTPPKKPPGDTPMSALGPRGCKQQSPGVYLCAPGVLKGDMINSYDATQISNYPGSGQTQQNPTWVLDGKGYWLRKQFPPSLLPGRK